MNVYLDDTRPAPDGWTRCYWPAEVSGGPQAVESVTESLRALADGLLDVALLMADPHDARAKAARLRTLAG